MTGVQTCALPISPKFTIYEIGEPNQKQAERRRAGDVITDADHIELMLAAEQPDRKDRPEKAAVERHAPLPQLEHAHRIKEHLGFVKNAIAKPSAKDDAKRCIKNKIINMPLGHRRAGLRDQFGEIPPAEHDARDIT